MDKKEIHGILLLDKPLGQSSNQALQKVKWLFRTSLFKAKKAGHTGSLDPLASGMLPICFGEATKFSQYLLDADKVYQVTAKLGIKTTTGDAEGEIIADCSPVNIPKAQLEKVLEEFKGEIQQIPSMYSALKHNGKPLYEYARKGIVIERPARTIQIYSLELLNSDADTFELRIACSKGTYIRTLIEDIGDKLGVGAYVTTLRRLQAGSFDPDKMVSIEQLTDKLQNGQPERLLDWVLPIGQAVQHLTAVHCADASAYYLRQGQAVVVPHAPDSGSVRLIHREQGFIGVGSVLSDGRIAPVRLVSSVALNTHF